MIKIRKVVKKKLKKYYHENKIRDINKKKLRGLKHRLLNKESYRQKRLENKSKIKEYRIKNIERNKKKNKEYRDKNPHIINAITAKRRAYRIKATPKWLTKEHKQDMRTFYKKSNELQKETGIKYHVDHIVPLQGDNVCGLHVPWNLQILKATENISKSNKLVRI